MTKTPESRAADAIREAEERGRKGAEEDHARAIRATLVSLWEILYPGCTCDWDYVPRPWDHIRIEMQQRYERGRLAGLREAEQIAANENKLAAMGLTVSAMFATGRIVGDIRKLSASPPTDEKQGQPAEESGRQSAIHRSTVHVWNEVNGEDYCNRCGILAAHGQSGTDCQGYIPLDRLCLLAAPSAKKETR